MTTKQAQEGSGRGRLMLLDTASMYFRAFFGVPEITRPRRHPRQRGPRNARLRQRAGRATTSPPTSSLLGRRLASAVAGRPDPDLQGAPRGRGAPRALDVEEVPDPLELQIPIIREMLDAFGIP